MSYMKDRTGRRLDTFEVASRLIQRADPVYRSLGQRKVMASPPTITVGTAATITAQQIGNLDDPRLRFLGGETQRSGDSNYKMNRPPRRSDGTFNTSTSGTYLGVEFMFDGTDVEMRTLASGNPSVIFTVDGELVSDLATKLGNTVSNTWIKLTFATRRTRRIGIYMSNMLYRGIAVGATDTVWAVETRLAPMLAVLGDSLGEATNARQENASFDGYVHQLARLLGFRSNAQNSASGTGFIRVNSTTGHGNYASRLTDVIAAAPDVLIIPGTINDPIDGATAATLLAAAQPVYQAAKDALPNTLVVATGILDSRKQSSQSTLNGPLQTAAGAAGIPYIDTYGWFTGEGGTGATTGAGNGDFYRYGSDLTHPTSAGHLYLASRLAGVMRNLMRDIPT